MVDIQFSTAEISRGIKKEERRKKDRKKKPQNENIIGLMACPILHRAAIISNASETLQYSLDTYVSA